MPDTPRALWPHIPLNHVPLQEGCEPALAEPALCRVLALDPTNQEALHNLSLLRRGQARDHLLAGLPG